MAIDPTSRTATAMRESILKDAAAWWKRGPRMFKRSSKSSLRVAERNELDEMFDSQNAEWDTSMMDFYEDCYGNYGGDVNDLPWIKDNERVV